MEMKRKQSEEEEAEVEKKRERLMADRFSNLPESLQLHILSFLHTKKAVQTSIQLKTLNSLWTVMPVLNLNSLTFKKLYAFDNFVSNLLSLRDTSSKLKELTFNRRGVCSAKILKKVQDYVFSHGVEELKISIQRTRNGVWPTFGSSDSLTSLKLQSQNFVSYLNFGSLKNLTVLYFKHLVIKDLELFSMFPKLEKLTLHHCILSTDGNALRIHAPQLLELTIKSLIFHRYELTTPKLRFFEYHGSDLPFFKTHDGLLVLDTAVINFDGVYYTHEKERFNDTMIELLWTIQNAKSVTLSSSIILLLCLFPDKLVTRYSPFHNLKSLKVDLTYFETQKLFDDPFKWTFESSDIPSDVKAYLLRNSPDAVFTVISPSA